MVTKVLFQKCKPFVWMMWVGLLPFTDLQAQTYRIDLGGTTQRTQNQRSERYLKALEELRLSREQKKKDKGTEQKKKGKKKEETVQDTVAKVAVASPETVGNELPQQASKGDVQLTVFADGATKEQAIQTALRTAIEQAFGTFVSSHTEMLNDSLVRDEVATVSSGNIKSFECLSENYANGKCFVNVKAVVSTSNLIEYVKSKGGSAEIAGANFAANIKLYELNKENEVKAMRHLVAQLAEMTPMLYDFSIHVEELRNKDRKFICPYQIKRESNGNAKTMYDMLQSTIKALSMTETEYSKYRSLGMPAFRVWLLDWLPDTNAYGKLLRGETDDSQPCYLRSWDSMLELNPLIEWMKYCSMCCKLVIEGLGEYEMTLIPPKVVKEERIHACYQKVINVHMYETEDLFFDSSCKYLSNDCTLASSIMGAVVTSFDGDTYFRLPFLPYKKSQYYFQNQGELVFESLEEVGKISNIRVERITPKMDYKQFKEEIFKQIPQKHYFR
ncbi:MAG: hypothetical protein ACI37U_02785 [Bacteroides sp.]